MRIIPKPVGAVNPTHLCIRPSPASSVEEVAAYIREKGYSFDAGRFWGPAGSVPPPPLHQGDTISEIIDKGGYF